MKTTAYPFARRIAFLAELNDQANSELYFGTNKNALRTISRTNYLLNILRERKKVWLKSQPQDKAVKWSVINYPNATRDNITENGKYQLD